MALARFTLFRAAFVAALAVAIHVPVLGAADDAALADSARKATAFVTASYDGKAIGGAAFCIDPAGIFVTANHVVTLGNTVPRGQSARISIVVAPGTKDQRTLAATLFRRDIEANTALLKVETPGRLNAVALAPPAMAARLRETAEVITVGFPPGVTFTEKTAPEPVVGRGKITSLRRNAGALSVIQFDGTIGAFDGGAPLLDVRGKLIGITCGALPDARQLNFAVPTATAWDMLLQSNIVPVPALLVEQAAIDEYVKHLAGEPNASRAKLPDNATIDEGRKLVRQIFAAKYNDKSARGRTLLIQELLETAETTDDDPDGRYALLWEARELAIESGDMPSAFAATEMLIDLYNVVPSKVMSELVEQLAPKAFKRQDTMLVTAYGLGLMEFAASKDDKPLVKKLDPLIRKAVERLQLSGKVPGVEERLAKIK